MLYKKVIFVIISPFIVRHTISVKIFINNNNNHYDNIF